MSIESVDKLIRRHVQAVEGIKDAHAADFGKQLEEARKNIEGRIAAMPGTSIDAFQLRQVLHEVDASLFVLKQRGTGALLAGERDAAEMSLEHATRELKDLGRTFGETMTVRLDAAQALSDPMRGLLANQFETSVERYGLDLLNKIRGRLIQGTIAGDSPRDMAREIANQRTGAFGEVAKSEAERLVRTELSSAYGLAHQRAMRQANEKTGGELKKTWIHVGSYPCPICTALHGTTREMDGSWTYKSGKKTYTVSGSPAHPHCVCKTIATKTSWRKSLDKLGYLDKSRRISVAA